MTTKEKSIEKVINKHYNTLEYKIDNISKETVLKEIENLPNKRDSPIQLTGNDIFDITTTGMSLYDAMIQKGHIAGNQDPLQYFRKNKGITFEIVYMSPQKYLEESYKIHGRSVDYGKYKTSLEQYMYYTINLDKVNEYIERTLEGSKMPIPVLDYSNFTQEGRHRAVVAKELSVEEIPVLVVRTYEGELK